MVLFLAPCCAPCRIAQSSSSSDSVKVDVICRDVVVLDTIIFELPMLEQRVTVKQDTSLLINRYSRSEAIILADGELHHSLETIPQELRQPIASRVEVRDSVIYRERVITRVVEKERELSSWQRIQITGFYFLLAVFLALVLLKQIV